MSFAAKWMDLEIIMLGEINQKEEDNSIQYHLYVKSKNRKTQTHPYREHIGGCQQSGLIVEVGEMGEWDQKVKENNCLVIGLL